MTIEGPPLMTSNGKSESGQFSILIIWRLVHRANSVGNLCRLGLSLMYRDSRFTRSPKRINEIQTNLLHIQQLFIQR